MFLGIFLVGAVLSIKGIVSVGAIVAALQLMVYIASPLVSLSSNIAEIKSASEVSNQIQKRMQSSDAQEGQLKKRILKVELSSQIYRFNMKSKKCFRAYTQPSTKEKSI